MLLKKYMILLMAVVMLCLSGCAGAHWVYFIDENDDIDLVSYYAIPPAAQPVYSASKNNEAAENLDKSSH